MFLSQWCSGNIFSKNLALSPKRLIRVAPRTRSVSVRVRNRNGAKFGTPHFVPLLLAAPNAKVAFRGYSCLAWAAHHTAYLRSTIQVRPVILNTRLPAFAVLQPSSRLGATGGARARHFGVRHQR